MIIKSIVDRLTFWVTDKRKFIYFFIFPVDLISGFNVATVNHDSRIDWLEVRITLLTLKYITYSLKFSESGDDCTVFAKTLLLYV